MTTPAGWYDDPHGGSTKRWWDGAVWTDHVQAVPPAPQPDQSPVPPPPPMQPGHSPTATPTTSASGSDVLVPPAVLAKPAGGLLGGGKKALEAENAELRAALSAIGATERERLKADIEGLRSRHAATLQSIQQEEAQARQDLAAWQAQVVATSDEAILQEVGIYEYRHPLDDSAAYVEKLKSVKAKYKDLARRKEAVVGATNWQVNGSVKEGTKMVTDLSKLMLRAYNNEADNAIRSMRPHKLNASAERLQKARETISKLGRTMSIHVTDGYHLIRLQELELTADFLAKKEEEKEEAKEEKARLREEAKARKEYEKEKQKLEKELEKESAHYESALAAMREGSGDEAEIAAAEIKLAEIQAAIQGVEEREANVRAGYVYVISNIGAFGNQMVKIGMTRRLEPQDRVRELGDASVPFRYDTHLLYFSEDAVGLENALHKTFADQRVNLVNLRREFFYISPHDVRDALASMDEGALLSFEGAPEALEWHQSQNLRPGDNQVTATEPPSPP